MNCLSGTPHLRRREGNGLLAGQLQVSPTKGHRRGALFIPADFNAVKFSIHTEERFQALQVVVAVCLRGAKPMLTARSVAVRTAVIMTTLGFLVGAHADLCMMMQAVGAGTGCYSVVLSK